MVPILYKYMIRRHAEDLVQKGTVRIGTLASFRDVERHGQTIGDGDEGRLLPMEHVVSASSEVPGTISDFVQAHVGPIRDNVIVEMEDCLFVEQHEFPDCFIFCATLVCDRTLMAQFGYDTCVVIRNPRHFFRAITTALLQRRLVSGPPRIAECIYADRNFDWRSAAPGHPAFLKPPMYRGQNEVRAVWRPILEPVEPVTIQAPTVARGTSLVEVVPTLSQPAV